jgi:hypothetical protein
MHEGEILTLTLLLQYRSLPHLTHPLLYVLTDQMNRLKFTLSNPNDVV